MFGRISGMGRARIALGVAALLVFSASLGQDGLLFAARTLAAVVPAEALTRFVDGENAINDGRDGRLTVLLLGSDARGGGIDRTDTIIVAQLNGKKIAAASIPRDMVKIPKPGGGTYDGAVNGLLRAMPGSTVGQKMTEFEKVIENFLGVEIDYHAMVKFKGFDVLVEAIEPVTIDIGSTINDGTYWDDPKGPQGVFFPKASNYKLYRWQNGKLPQLCNGKGATDSAHWCHRAMPFVRSRKGPNNSDYARARRQQNFVMAAIKAVSQSKLNSLLSKARGQQKQGQFYTNIQLTAGNAASLYKQLNGASLGAQVVFSPSTYASNAPSFTIVPNVPAIRGWVKNNMGGSGGGSPNPTATPTQPGPTPTSPRPTPTAGGPTPTAGVPTPTIGATPTTGITLSPGISPDATATTTLPAISPSGDLSPSPSVGTSPSTSAGPTSSATTVGVVVTPPSDGATPTPAGGAVVPPVQGEGLSGLAVALVVAVAAGLGLLALAAFIGWRRTSSRRLRG